MTGSELADALRRFADFIEEQPKLASLTLRVAPATTITIGSEEAQRKDRQRRGGKSAREPDDPGQKAGQKRDEIRDKKRDKSVTGDGPDSEALNCASRALASDPIKYSGNNPLSGSERSDQTAAAAAAAGADKKRDTNRDRDADKKRDTTKPEGKIQCPHDLKLNDGQRAMFEMQMGIAGWVIDELTKRFVAKNMSDPDDRRARATWLKCLSQVVSQDGRDLQRKGNPDAGSTSAASSAPQATGLWQRPAFKPDPNPPPPPAALRRAHAPRPEAQAPTEDDAPGESGVMASAAPSSAGAAGV